MSISWHDLIRFHYPPSEAHKKPNVWAGNGMGSPIWTSSHMDYFIQNKSHLSVNSLVVESMWKCADTCSGTSCHPLHFVFLSSLFYFSFRFNSNKCSELGLLKFLRTLDAYSSNLPFFTMQFVVFVLPIIFLITLSLIIPPLYQCKQVRLDTRTRNYWWAQEGQPLQSPWGLPTEEPAERVKEIQGLTD